MIRGLAMAPRRFFLNIDHVVFQKILTGKQRNDFPRWPICFFNYNDS
jgi:hypothetical protein